MLENQINSNDFYSQEIQNNSSDNPSQENYFDEEEQNEGNESPDDDDIFNEKKFKYPETNKDKNH